MRPERDYLLDMRIMAQKARDLAADVSREQFDEREVLQFALIHLVEIIGEAARHVPPEVHMQYPQLPWTDNVGMRTDWYMIIVMSMWRESGKRYRSTCRL